MAAALFAAVLVVFALAGRAEPPRITPRVTIGESVEPGPPTTGPSTSGPPPVVTTQPPATTVVPPPPPVGDDDDGVDGDVDDD